MPLDRSVQLPEHTAGGDDLEALELIARPGSPALSIRKAASIQTSNAKLKARHAAIDIRVFVITFLDLDARGHLLLTDDRLSPFGNLVELIFKPDRLVALAAGLCPALVENAASKDFDLTDWYRWMLRKVRCR